MVARKYNQQPKYKVKKDYIAEFGGDRDVWIILCPDRTPLYVQGFLKFFDTKDEAKVECDKLNVDLVFEEEFRLIQK